MKVFSIFFFTFITLSTFWQDGFSRVQTFNTEVAKLKVSEITSGLDHPWSMVWLAPQVLLVAERNGQLVHLDLKRRQKSSFNLPSSIKVYQRGQGGLLDLALDPQYSQNGWIYLTFSIDKGRVNTTALSRFKWVNNRLANFEVLFEAQPFKSGGYHFGSRLSFGSGGQLFMSVGERGEKTPAQDKQGHLGKIIQFQYRKDFNGKIYSLGHRNPQGMAWDKLSGQLFVNEHGAKGGDELNIIREGRNYGWPVISYGVNYSGTKIGEGTRKQGLEQPLYYWDPSIAPSGLLVYSGQEFLAWKSHLLLLSLKFGRLVRLELNPSRNKVIHEEQIFKNDFGRLRDLIEDDQGKIYLLSDSANGKLLLVEKND